MSVWYLKYLSPDTKDLHSTVKRTSIREKLLNCHFSFFTLSLLYIFTPPVVQRLDSSIHRINHNPADSIIDFRNTVKFQGGGVLYPRKEVFCAVCMQAMKPSSFANVPSSRGPGPSQQVVKLVKKQNWMHCWHYCKGLIYYRPIFRLKNLAFLRARAIPRENII